jgi:carboxymethylenebutenolidase
MKIELPTDDGVCPAHVFHPDRPAPGVILYMDGLGMRPALLPIAERVTAAGYHVLMPDLFYRAGAYEPPDPRQIFSDEKLRTEWFKKIATTTNAAAVMRDTRAFIDYFDLKDSKIGVFGYCMGGRMALTAAGSYPEHIAACAAFHPGNLANDAPDSPHLLADRIRARVYVAAASEDSSFPEEQKQRLADALTRAKVDHRIETYPARHGWVPSDTPVHHPGEAERAFQNLFALFGETLRRS